MKTLSVIVALLLAGCGNSPEPSSEEKILVPVILKTAFRSMMSAKLAVRRSIAGIASDKKYSHLYHSLVDMSEATGRVRNGYAKNQSNILLSIVHKGKNSSEIEASIRKRLEEDYLVWAQATQESLERALEESPIFIDKETWDEIGYKGIKRLFKSSRELSRELYPNGLIQRGGGILGPESISEIHTCVASIREKLFAPIEVDAVALSVAY